MWPVGHKQKHRRTHRKDTVVWKEAIHPTNVAGTAHGKALPCGAVGDNKKLGKHDRSQINGGAATQGRAALTATDGQAGAPHVGAQAQAQAEGNPGQATAALVHDLAERADRSSTSANSGASSRALLHSGASIGDKELDEWMLENLDHPEMRSKRVDVLTAAAKPIQYSHAEVLMTIGNIYDRNVD